jgi:GAF domain-containing protein
MDAFLGVPLMVGAQACGNLYVAGKAGEGFTEEDEGAATTLAHWAAVAVGRLRRRARADRGLARDEQPGALA